MNLIVKGFLTFNIGNTPTDTEIVVTIEINESTYMFLSRMTLKLTLKSLPNQKWSVQKILLLKIKSNFT